MITDKLENCSRYFSLGEKFELGFRFLEENNLNEFPEGKHEIAGDDVYVIISSYVTKDRNQSNPEAHKTYADIQFMISGSEIIGYDLLHGHKVFKEYDTEKDFMLYNEVKGSIVMEEGSFAVFFPEDIHQPGLILDKPENVKKAVVKVRL